MNNTEKMIAQAKSEFNKILTDLIWKSQQLEIADVERALFPKLIKLGLTLLKVWLSKKGIGKAENVIRLKNGHELPYHSTKERAYFSIFGEIEISRAYYWENGCEKGVTPLDAQLNLPERKYSYYLMEIAQKLGVDQAFDRASEIIEKIFDYKIWKLPLETANHEISINVEEFYEQKPSPAKETEGEILVVAVDGKGIPMLKREPAEKKHRLKRGEKNNRKKESVVSALYTIDRHKRSAEDVIGETKQAEEADNKQKKSDHQTKRPLPLNKQVRATLKGKDAAFKEIKREVQRRDSDEIKERVALVDGARSFQKKLLEYLPDFTIILDLYHVLEYLWEAAHVFYREGTDEAERWVMKHLTMLLEGKVGYVIGGLKQSMTKGKFSSSKQKVLIKIIKYFSNNRKNMMYNEYLGKGYPIGSGVVEGTCRFLVKDRMELTGMRWSWEGAEAMLQLRSVKVNGNWENYWRFHTKKEFERLYNDITVETLPPAA